MSIRHKEGKGKERETGRVRGWRMQAGIPSPGSFIDNVRKNIEMERVDICLCFPFMLSDSLIILYAYNHKNITITIIISSNSTSTHIRMWNLKHSNRLLDLKSKQQSHSRHLKALQSVKSTINNSTPKKYTFLQYKPKMHMKKHERNTEIERSNSILVNRMLTMPSWIGDGRAKGRGTTGAGPAKGEVWVKDSLNSGFMRKREMQIDQENQKIVRRLQSANSKYSQKAMVKSIRSYHKARTNMASSKMDQYYDFQSLQNKRSVELFQPRSQTLKARPFSAKR